MTPSVHLKGKNKPNILIIGAIALAIVILATAQSQQELQDELDNLTQELTNYSWFMNHASGAENIFDYYLLKEMKNG